MLKKRIQSALSVVEKSLYSHRIVSTGNMVLPGFLGLGAQKAGTNWLVCNLNHHPDLFVIGEPHYFDLCFHEPLRNYSKRFAVAEGRLCGDVTPAYGILRRDRIQFIRRIRPAMKLILILRHPVERSWSQARMDLGPHMDRDLSEVSDEEFMAHFHRPSSRRRSDYCSILANWMEWFPADQLFIEKYSTLREEPRELLSSIFGFLGVDAHADWDKFPLTEIVNKGQEMVIPGHFRSFLEEMYRSQCEALETRFGITFD